MQRPHMEVCLYSWAVRRSVRMEQMSKGRERAGSDEKGKRRVGRPWRSLQTTCKDLGFILSNMGSTASDR